MNERLKAQIQEDYREILQSGAGRRVLGGIFCIGRIHGAECMNEYQQGRRSVAVQIANTLTEISPHAVGECMKAYSDMVEECSNDRNSRSDSGGSVWGMDVES